MNAVFTQTELTSARLLAGLSELAYRPRLDIERDLAARGLTLEEFFNEPLPGTQGFCAKGKDFACFVFRGTSLEKTEDAVQFEDVLIDLMAWPVPAAFGKVHLGFRAAFDAIKDAVGKRAQDFQSVGLPIYIAGHSLGGALAVLAAAAVIDQKIPIGGLYTFGQPRVGNAGFEKHYFPTLEKRYYRFTNGQDIVPLLPLYFMGYRHWGTASYHFSEDGELKKISSWWKWYLVETLAVLIWSATRSKNIRKFLKALFNKKSQEPGAIRLLAKEALKDFMEIFSRDILADHDMKACYIKNLERVQLAAQNEAV